MTIYAEGTAHQRIEVRALTSEMPPSHPVWTGATDVLGYLYRQAHMPTLSLSWG